MSTETQCLAALVQAVGSEPVAATLRRRIAELEASQADRHEQFRHGGALKDFLADSARTLALLSTAAARLRAIEPAARIPVRPEAATAIFNMVQACSLRRDKDIRALRAERLRRLDEVKGRLAEANDGIQALGVLFANGSQFTVEDPQLRSTGACAQLDLVLQRLASPAEERRRCQKLLDLLDSENSPGALIRLAVEATGREKVVRAIKAALGVVPDPAVESAVKALAAVEGRLGSIDPDSQLAAAVAAERDAARATLAKAKAARAAELDRQSEGLVDAAGDGQADAIGHLMALATGPFQAAIDSARSTDGQLIGTIACMIDTA